jgi:nucleotide-binding universal stress UspA family protein
MFNHILVVSTPEAIDHTLQQTKPIARRLSAKITLLCCLTSPASRGEHFVDPLEWHIRKVETTTDIDRIADTLRKDGIDVKTELTESDDPVDIVDYADQHAVDLILVVRRINNVNDMMYTMLKHSNIPIITLHQDYELDFGEPVDECFNRVMVPLDGSQRAESALTTARVIAQLCKSELVLAHVVQKPEMPRRAPLSDHDQRLSEEVVEANQKQAKRYLEQLAERLDAPVKIQITVHSSVISGLQSLIDQEKPDVVVLSAHGYTGDPQQPCGHITQRFVGSSHIPVITVQDLRNDYSHNDNQHNDSLYAKVR